MTDKEISQFWTKLEQDGRVEICGMNWIITNMTYQYEGINSVMMVELARGRDEDIGVGMTRENIIANRPGGHLLFRQDTMKLNIETVAAMTQWRNNDQV